MDTERKCKGSVILDMVKVIRAFKDLPWDEYLEPRDRKIIDSMVIPTEWYPVDSYQRMGLAVYELVAKGNTEALEAFGRQAMDELFQGPYKPFLDKKDPQEALKRFLELRKSIFNFSRMRAERTGPKSSRVVITDFGEFDKGLDLFQALLAVHLKRIVELNGGRDVRCRENMDGSSLVCELEWS